MLAATVHFESKDTVFHVENHRDHIQGHHARGEFYELDHLLAHRAVVHRRSSVIDVGANVGNHTLFYAQHSNALRIYPIEANPAAIRIFAENLASNAGVASAVDMTYLGLAVGATAGYVRLAATPENNLGGTTFAPSDLSEDIKRVPLDELEFQHPISLLKIDVEGDELDVLAGAERLIAADRPAIAIEVNKKNEAAFWKWSKSRLYTPINGFFDYVGVKNYLLIPTF